ncbi:MAG: 30S ribosomal protein S21 [bacterium]|nr:30S ribosomal protein S21 [bacterium]
MIVVTRKKGDSKDSLFRKFTKVFIDEEIVDTIRDRLFYKKPSLKRREHEKERLQNRNKRRSSR